MIIIACRPRTAASSRQPTLPSLLQLGTRSHSKWKQLSASPLRRAPLLNATVSSAQLEAGRRLDGVQQLVPHQVLVAELGQLEQVHAGAGGGQALQVGAPVVDAEDRVELLRRWRERAVNERQRNWSQRDTVRNLKQRRRK